METEAKSPREIIIKKKVDTDHLNGLIEIRALTYPERVELSKKSVTTVVDGEKGPETVINDSLDRSLEYYNLAMKQVKRVDVTILGEGTHLESVDELMCYEQGVELVMQIATDLISGVSLGNVKLKDLDKTV